MAPRRLFVVLALGLIGLGFAYKGLGKHGQAVDAAAISEVAFSRPADGMVVARDWSTGRERPLVGHLPGVPGLVAWSPDGNDLALVVASAMAAPRRPPTTHLYIVDLRRDRVRLVSGSLGADFPAWSPDGRSVAFGGRAGLQIVDIDRARARRLNLVGSCPVFSPDGQTLAYCGIGPTSSGTAVWTTDLAGKAAHRLTDGVGVDTPAGWTLDSKELVYTSSHGEGTSDIRAMSLKNGRARTLLATRGAQDANGILPSGDVLFSDWRTDRARWGLLDVKTRKVRWLPKLAGLPEPLATRGPALRADAISSASTRPATSEMRMRLRVNGVTLFIECEGHGQPTVVFDSGLGVASDSWIATELQVASKTRACRFDRPGLGLSGPPGKRHDAQAFAGDLSLLLQKGGVQGSLILVGASFGGLDVRLFAAAHPDRVGGMVLVDPIVPGFDAAIERLLKPGAARDRRRALEANPEQITFDDIVRSEAEVGALPPRISFPLTVIRHGLPFEGGRGFPSEAVERLWTRLQVKTARLSQSGRLVVARRSHHRIAESEPRLVAAEIERILKRVR